MPEYKIVISEQKQKEIDALCQKLRITQGQLFNVSLHLMKWAAEQKEKGRDVCSIHSLNDDDISELDMPCLTNYIPEASTVSLPAVKS